MLIKDLEKLRKRALRERIYEEIVHLILSGELPSGGWVDEKRVIHKLRVSRTPFREAIGILAKGGLVEIRPYRDFYVRSFSRDETADIYELFKRLECFAVELAMPLMSDRDINGFENILIEGVIALQRGDMNTYAMRDREFYKNIAEQSRNSALVEALARVALQIQLFGTITSVSREFAERAAHGCDDIIQAFEARDIPRAAFLVRARISHTQEVILARYPSENSVSLTVCLLAPVPHATVRILARHKASAPKLLPQPEWRSPRSRKYLTLISGARYGEEDP